MTPFEEVYRANAWGGGSGPGSGRAATAVVATVIEDLVQQKGISSVLDVGCGDGHWMPDLPGYVGIDVSAIAVELARARHPERDYRMAYIRNVGQDFDLVICRDVIQHLSFGDGIELINAIEDLAPRYLLASSYKGGVNIDIQTGADAYAVDMLERPFCMPPPEAWYFDGYGYEEENATTVRDPRKHLGLWRS